MNIGRRRRNLVARLFLVAVTLAVAKAGYAQEAGFHGSVTDATGGTLPGVVIKVLHEASGNTFEAVTDGMGRYRIPVRVGIHQVSAELSGFTTVIHNGLELLAGQQALVNFTMSVAGVQESVTVSAAAPLIDVSQSRLSGNIDARQMQDLPVNGRNFLDLSMLAPGARTNAVGNAPSVRNGFRGDFQVNVDGQSVASTIVPTRQNPSYSRDTIAEFEYIANRFDATQGRSNGTLINVITKSGTNTPSGSVSGYFRDDRFNAADHIQDRVLPYSNQQVSTTFGGPIRQNRAHFFAGYEYEREPRTFAYSSQYPRFNIDQNDARTAHKTLVRGDYQFSPQTRLNVRWSRWDEPAALSGAGGATTHPSTAITFERRTNQIFGSLTHAVTNRALNDLKVGIANGYDDESPIVNDPRLSSLLPAIGYTGNRTLAIELPGYRIGSDSPSYLSSDSFSIRDDFSYSFTKGGRHDMKVGGSYFYTSYNTLSCALCNGVIDAQGGAVPGNLEDLFPVWDDPSTWNVAALSRITRSFSWTVGPLRQEPHRHDYGAWLQDDWSVTPRLTLNLGLRYDLSTNLFGSGLAFPPFLEAENRDDRNNISPRLGVAFSLNDKTVLRGGLGRYFGNSTGSSTVHTILARETAEIEVRNDGRPDFAVNPFNGPAPTYEDVIRLGQTRSVLSDPIAHPDSAESYSYQASSGVARQLSDTMAVSADYAYIGTRQEGGYTVFARNINLSYNPATGANYPYTDISRLPYPDWGPVHMEVRQSYSNYHALETAFTKRMSRGVQASATYLLSVLKDADPPPVTDFPVAPDMGGEYTLARGDQRHRAVFNGIWDLGLGFQLSGLYHFGSGDRFVRTYGGDLRRMGVASTNRLRPNGTIVPRNDFVGRPIHRVDVRLQKGFAVGRARIEGLVETFNLFNHENYGSYVTNEASRSFGQPSANSNVAYQPRMLQLGARFRF